jgi:hypothetical protein
LAEISRKRVITSERRGRSNSVYGGSKPLWRIKTILWLKNELLAPLLSGAFDSA